MPVNCAASIDVPVTVAVFEAVSRRDYPMLQGAFLLFTVSVVLANAAADLVVAALDPQDQPPDQASHDPTEHSHRPGGVQGPVDQPHHHDNADQARDLRLVDMKAGTTRMQNSAETGLGCAGPSSAP